MAEVTAHHLARDPNLADAAAERIARLVRELYANLAAADRGVRVHLRAAATFTPEARRKLGELPEPMQRKLTATPRLGTDRGPGHPHATRTQIGSRTARRTYQNRYGQWLRDEAETA
jgi:hypothetical protein